MITTSQSIISKVLATAALIAYVCLILTSLAVVAEAHCCEDSNQDEPCEHLGDCRCACGLWGISHTEVALPQPRPANHFETPEYHPVPADRVDGLFRPPRLINA